MRDLTKAELEEYFRFARADTAAGNFHMDQAKLVGEIAMGSGLMNGIFLKLLAIQAAGIEVELPDALISLWVSAFQMGRECESRLITTALKTGKDRK